MDPIRFPYLVHENVTHSASLIRLVLFDVDGVLTDGRLFLDDTGRETKAFYARDGHGLRMLQMTGVEIGIITGRTSRVVELRAAELGVKHLFQGCRDKLPVYDTLVRECGLTQQAVAFVGDDIVDLPIMARVGLAVAVQDAHYLVKERAHWVTPSAGGCGAARDVCELIMEAQGNYEREFARFLS
ncbi:MAG: KdsC family phosphatase [Acidiferrobacteraceae bacterium]|jgi:3-deoxy-D-manno-octulosonate 8-phosphate phosphatase (KDO 8-P phosphatase)